MGFELSDKCINRLKIICIYSSEYAFNPKSEKQRFKLNSSQSKAEDLRQSIEERIKRQTSLLSNEDVISKLSDKGNNIRQVIAKLHLQLEEMNSSGSKEVQTPDVIDVDNLSSVFERGINI